MQRDIILDLLVFNQLGQIAAVKRGQDDIYEKNIVSTLILTLPNKVHPVVHIQNYLGLKNIQPLTLKMLPALYLNTFDSEPEKEYLVLSFKITCNHTIAIQGDTENSHIEWMDFAEFKSHPMLMPEFKQNNFVQILEGKALFYKGHYQDSDYSNKVLELDTFS